MNEPQELVTTSRLAELFQIHRKSIAEWRKLGEDVPEKVDGKEPLDEWRSWFAANPDKGYKDGKPRKDHETLKCEKLQIDIEIAQLKLDTERSKVISRDEVREMFVALGSAVNVFCERASREIPQVTLGLSIEKGMPKARAKMRELQEMLTDRQSEFWIKHQEKKENK